MTAASPWQSGQRIGSYLLLRELARGGMGEIWLALDRTGLQVERLVVIKRVLRSSDDDPQHVTLFFDEARIASQLHHPNVVQVFTMGDAEGSPYLVMEYLPGQSLGRVVRAFAKHGARVPHEVAARIIADAARGLGYAHRRKGLDGRALRIVHRDVSPQNVLVTYDGHVKVLDFGIAVAEGRMTKTATGLVRGKIAYMSPEQAQGEPLDASADVFSLGVMLWELLTGKRLHGEADDLAVLRRLAMETAELPDPRTLEPSIEAGLAAIAVRALRRQPLGRYADGVELCEALDAWLHTQPPLSLERAMGAVFGEEIAALPELQQAVVPTPSTPASTNGTVTIDAQPAPAVSASASPTSKGARLGLFALAGALLLTITVAVFSRAGSQAVPDAGLTVVLEARVIDAGLTVTVVDAGVVAEEDGGSKPEPTQRPKPPKEAPTASRPALSGTLSLDTEPWTKVFLAKRALGETPLVEQVVPAGTLRLRLVNEAEGIDTLVDLKVNAGQLTTKQYKLK